MTYVVKLCTSGTLQWKKYPITFLSFLYVEVQIEQIKMIKSLTGLAGLIFEINDKNWQFITFLQSKSHIDADMLRSRCLYAMHAWYFCDHVCTS